VLEHRAAFMDALRGDRKFRKRIFDTIEQRHADDFANGRAGMELYDTLLSAVRDSGAPEAAEEFENRFFPLLKPDRARSRAEIGPPTDTTDQDRKTAEDRHSRSRGWISALCVAAAILGAFCLGFNLLKTTRAGLPIATEAPAPIAKGTVPTSEKMTEAGPTTSVEARIPAADANEPASEAIVEPTPAQAAE
jgi:hypothetical protein